MPWPPRTPPGVTHRDLKPENLMIADGGYAKVLDFGVAKLRADMAPAGVGCRLGALRPAVFGTVGYMSPEQVQGKPLDPRTDIFSFGCVLYEAITGTPRVSGDDVVRDAEADPGARSRQPIAEPLPPRAAAADRPQVSRQESGRSVSVDAGALARSPRRAPPSGGGDAPRDRRARPVAAPARGRGRDRGAGARRVVDDRRADSSDARPRSVDDPASHAQRHRHRRGDVARWPIPGVGRVDGRHARSSRASARRGSQHRARAAGASRLLGHHVFA